MALLKRDETPSAAVVAEVLAAPVEGFGRYMYPNRKAAFISEAVSRLISDPPTRCRPRSAGLPRGTQGGRPKDGGAHRERVQRPPRSGSCERHPPKESPAAQRSVPRPLGRRPALRPLRDGVPSVRAPRERLTRRFGLAHLGLGMQRRIECLRSAWLNPGGEAEPHITQHDLTATREYPRPPGFEPSSHLVDGGKGSGSRSTNVTVGDPNLRE